MSEYFTEEQIAERIEEIIKEHIGADDDISPETNLQNDLDVDSLERVELGVKLEKTFDVKLAIEDLRSSETVADLAQLVARVEKEKTTPGA